MSRSLLTLPRKIGAQALVLLRDPKRFIENLDYSLHPEKLRQKLLGFEFMPPMHFDVEPVGNASPHVNVLLPKLEAGSLTGGPNTALMIAYGLAALGVPIRLLAVDEALPEDVAGLYKHIGVLVGQGHNQEQIRRIIALGSTVDPNLPMKVGPHDVFLATYWTTAFRLKPLLDRFQTKEFLYLIQDFEPSFYPWSSSYAQALETYSMPYRGLINEQLLAYHLKETKTGRFAEAGFADRCAVFEPAVDRRLFHAVDRAGPVRTLLFYARPGQPRNLFGIGFEALRIATAHPVFAENDWRYLAIGGGSLGRMPLEVGQVMTPAPWMSYEAYAGAMRAADILLCPMLSPHTGYPVLEMAACRGIPVTNTFGSKTADRLRNLSTHIVAATPSIEGLAAALVEAGSRALRDERLCDHVALPEDWPSALATTIDTAAEMFREIVARCEP